MFRKKIKLLFGRALSKLHYGGLILILAIMYQNHFSAQISEQTLRDSVKQQETLRNILWMNLMLQRAATLSLSRSNTNDNTSNERALAIIDSIPNFLPTQDSGAFNRNSFVDKTKNVRNLLVASTSSVYPLSSSDVRTQLIDQVEKIGTELNASESTEWFALLEKNKVLINDFNVRQREVYLTYLLFIFYLGLLAWISARKEKAEVQLLETEAKLLEASKLSALGEMAGGVAHEVNNPLAIIHTRSSQLQELVQDVPLDQPEVIRIAKDIETTALRIAKIINGLRFLSRDGTLDPFQPAEINAIIEDTLSLCAEKFKNHGIKVSVRLLTEPVFIECRATQIAQVLLNLMNNSYDAIALLPDRWIEIALKNNENEIELSVTDSGLGIPRDIQSKLFQPFFTTKDVGKGTGLGLSISKGIISTHGGKFTIDIRCKNTRFLICLPKKQTIHLNEVAA
jgi:signal transduction histidine kinase